MTVLTKETFTSFFSFFVGSKNLICEVLFKLRPYGGLIGMKKCSWEKYLNDYKFLCLHAFLQDAAAFKHELIRIIKVLLYVARQL